MDKYIPPFEISNEMLKIVSDIMEKIGKLDSFTNLDKTPYLRKQTKINSVHSSVAIENNPLSLEQVKDVINGKLVIGKQKDIQEVKNAYKAYEMLKDINPYSIDDLKKVHGVMTFLVEEVSGEFRTSSEGVFDDNGNCIFVCPPGDRVNLLMNDLFKWLNENAYKYGYILRYKKDKVYMTGYTYEPWHYRYVGVETATIIKNENLTFEEFYVKYKGLY